MSRAAVAVSWIVTLVGGLVILGGLGALTNDSPVGVTPYRTAWVAWALEVFALLVCLAALLVAKPFTQWRAAIIGCLAIPTAVLIPITDLVFTAKGALPGSNGSDTRANTTAAGLVICLIGNYFLALACCLFDDAPTPAERAAESKIGV